MGGTVFVTVGSTLFDALVEAIDNPALAEVLLARGYSALVIQLGNGKHLPTRLLPAGATSGVAACGLRVEWFRFAPSLTEHFKQAELIISHAGSGSTFESLRAGRKLVAVPNPILMDNHQQELAEELARQGFCVCSPVCDLLATLKGMDLDALVPYQPGDPQAIASEIDLFMNRPPKGQEAAGMR
eukprot:jgi/Tetstr1/465739/TSEL_010364.t1